MLHQLDRDALLDEFDRLKFAFANAGGDGEPEFAWGEMRVAVKRLRALLPPDLDTADVEPSLLERFTIFLDCLWDSFNLGADVGVIDYPVDREFYEQAQYFLAQFAPEAPEPTRAADAGEPIPAAPEPASVDPTAAEANFAQFSAAVMEDNTLRILAIAKDSKKSADAKMDEIVRIDRRYEGRVSSEWGDLLQVTDSAIRQTDAWIKFQREKQQD